MPPKLRADVQLLRTGPREFVLRDPAHGEGFTLGIEERFLASMFDGEHEPPAIAEAFRQRFGTDIPVSYIEQFAEQLRRAGLLEEVAAQAETPEQPKPQVPAEITAGAVPAARGDVVGPLNHTFDWLTLLFGWLVHPLMLVPLAALALLAAGVLLHRFDAFYGQLVLLSQRLPLGALVAVWLLQITLCISLPVALATGIACRKFGGRVRRFHLAWLNRTLPYFECDTGDSFVQMSETERWTLLTLGIWMHLLIGSLVIVAWAMAPNGSALELFLLLLIVPSVVRLLIRLNVLMPLDGYAALSYWLELPELYDRAKSQVRAWLVGATPPEALVPAQRAGFLVYGLAVYAWKIVVHVAVIGGGGWFLTRRLGGSGAVIVVALVCWWYSRTIEDWIMSNWFLRWVVRGGGRWYIRWPIRLAVVAALVACLFIPYQHEVGGEFRLLPSAVVGVRAPIAGQIDAIHVVEGQRVETNAPIATLAAREQRAAVETTRAELAAARANLDMLLAGTRTEKVEAARKEVELAQLRVDYHTTELQRVELLAKTDTVSEAELENARFQKESAEKLLAAAQQKLAELEAGVRDEQIRAAEAEVERLTALLKHHQEQLDLAEIRAPIAGRVVTAAVETRVGQYVQPGDLVAVVQDSSSLRAEIAATEDAIPWLAVGQTVNLRFWGLNGGLVKGKIVDISGSAIRRAAAELEPYRSDRERLTEQIARDDRDRVVRVYAELQNPPENLLPEMTGYARIEVRPDTLGAALARPLKRFFLVEVWSWLP